MFDIKEEGVFKYIETNPDKEALVLLHGLFGALSNFSGIIDHFRNEYNVVVPILPIYELPLTKVSLTGLVEHIRKFIDFKGYKDFHLLGNSLGGHLTLLYVLSDQDRVRSMTLTGSSGLFESGMGNTFPRRGSYEYIKNKTEQTFYNPEVATKELVDEVFEIVNDKSKAIRIIYTAKSAIRHNVGDKLGTIHIPTLIIWGENDEVTPPFVAKKFNELIENSELIFVEKCGHAPMMEHPELFNEHLEKFLTGLKAEKITS